MSKKSKYKNFILPFVLFFCLTTLAAWLFIPWLVEGEYAGLAARNPSRAVGALTESSIPEHVFFSPGAHSRDACNECHAFSETEYLAVFKLKKGDEKAAAGKIFYQTAPVSMDECMRCHAVAEHKSAATASESCGSCHR